MKEKVNNENKLVGRKRSQYRGVCNSNFGGSGFRRATVNDSSKPRSETDAFRSSEVSANRYRYLLNDQGSVTAEFAVVLPGVILILFLAISVLAAQTGRIALVGIAAESARALARGESQDLVEQLVQSTDVSGEITYHVTFSDLSVCVEVTRVQSIRALGNAFPLEVSERQCARKGGL
jgi:hypothetical protein